MEIDFMLVLTRNLDEITLIGKDIKLIVLGIKGKQVRIGIEAPKEIPILRNEIHCQSERKDTHEII